MPLLPHPRPKALMHPGTNRLTEITSMLEQDAGKTVGRLGDLRLGSHFQPIYSLSHARVVGHEALLRTRGADGHPIPPPEVFAQCKTTAELSRCDRLSRFVHMANFSAAAQPDQWLFLNVHPETFQKLPAMAQGGGNYLRAVQDHFNLPGQRVVLEVLESEVLDVSALEDAMALMRAHGSLIAIDDFGAGHSNFDRVWRLQPDIVKLDRSLIARAARERRAQRVVSQMVSLLHECGAMVLMEGVETIDEALLAMESDADMVQGYFFGRPQPELMPTGHSPHTITQLYAGLGHRREQQRAAHRNELAPYRHAIGNAGVLMEGGHSMNDACNTFLQLAGAEVCYVLDNDGYQLGPNLWCATRNGSTQQGYEPLSNSDGACWARRPYFHRAVESVGKVQVTRPYRTLHGNHMCVTVSFAFLQRDGDQRRLRVVCGDVAWNEPSAPCCALPS